MASPLSAGTGPAAMLVTPPRRYTYDPTGVVKVYWPVCERGHLTFGLALTGDLTGYAPRLVTSVDGVGQTELGPAGTPYTNPLGYHNPAADIQIPPTLSRGTHARRGRRRLRPGRRGRRLGERRREDHRYA